ncbi:MAG: energy-coupling factor transporter transmembrane component T family protein [Mycetocola sp.]
MTAQAHRAGFALPSLARVNPLAKIAAALPAMAALVLANDPVRPALLLAITLLVLTLFGHRGPVTTLVILAACPILVGILSLSFGAWISTSTGGVVLVTLGPYAFSTGMWLSGLTTALRLVAIGALSLIAGLTTTGDELVRAITQQLRLPYRIAWAGVTALRFVPRLHLERELIHSARRVRGSASSGPLGQVRERVTAILPLMISAIRHAERVGQAMDSRAFGAFTARTERQRSIWSRADTAFVLAGWALSGAALLAPAWLAWA